ncbi:MAG: hypothetical protein Q4E13_07245 [Clostridia bacterium]|nr:hypothetical protein [Clostridia bacterium]
MGDILLKAGGFLLTILAGYLFKRTGLLRASDANILKKIMLNLTLPCVMVAGIQNMNLQLALIVPLIAGFVIDPLFVVYSQFLFRKREPQMKVLGILNLSSFNIGSFLVPFLTAFFPASAVSISSMFDIGNGIYGTGLIFSYAQCVINPEAQFRPRDMLHNILHSTTLMTYLPMLLLFLCGVRLPDGVYTLLRNFGNSNAFLSFFIIGLMLEIQLEKEDVGTILKLLLSRYALSIPLAAAIWFLLPVDALVRQVLALCLLTPFSSVTPAFCASLGCKPTLASFVNALSLILSLIIVVILMVVWQI